MDYKASEQKLIYAGKILGEIPETSKLYRILSTFWFSVDDDPLSKYNIDEKK